MENLKFVKSNCDMNGNLYVAFLKGTFDRPQIMHKMNQLATKLNDNNVKGSIGVSIHRKEANEWLPAVMKKIETFVLFEILDQDYFETIDGVYFYIQEKST